MRKRLNQDFQDLRIYRICVAAILAVALSLTSCAYINCPCSPTLRVKEEYPPILTQKSGINVTSVKRIAIMPFESEDARYASYATSKAIEIFSKNPNFILVDAAEVKRLQESGQSLEGYVDAILTGNITFDVSKNSYKLFVGNSVISNSVYSQDRRDKRSGDPNNKATHDTYVNTIVVMAKYTYSLMLTKDGSFIGPIFGGGSSSRNYYGVVNPGDYPSTDGLYEPAIYAALQQIPEDFVFYKGGRVLEHIIQSDTTASDAVNEEIKEAFSIVGTSKLRYFFLSSIKEPSEKDIKRALEAYLGIYERHKNIVAAINASILYEYFEGTEFAARFMQKVYDDTGDSKAKLRLDEMNKTLEHRAGVATLHKSETEKKGGSQ